jgi:hypothetical protein
MKFLVDRDEKSGSLPGRRKMPRTLAFATRHVKIAARAARK